MTLEQSLAPYDYDYPAALIAQKPAAPRDAARLLVYHRGSGRIVWDNFRNLAKHLPPRSLIILNDTKVLPARLTLKKATGGAVRFLYLATEGSLVRGLADRKLAVGATLRLDRTLSFEVRARSGDGYLLQPSFPASKIVEVLERYGAPPLPPYIKHSPLTAAEIKEKYQSVFARVRGSVAAPTASLHFTPRLLAALEKAGHEIRYVTLHVNLGTFAPLTEAKLRQGKLHRETFSVSKSAAAAAAKAKKARRPVIAVGTTVARVLEAAADGHGRLRAARGQTDMFIREGYRFKCVDGLITNFHVPKSSLLMLVSALVGREKLLGLYKKAVAKKFALFSFGDGMLITD